VLDRVFDRLFEKTRPFVLGEDDDRSVGALLRRDRSASAEAFRLAASARALPAARRSDVILRDLTLDATGALDATTLPTSRVAGADRPPAEPQTGP
jgi:hypothetical protein